jgi:sulfur-carrier protein
VAILIRRRFHHQSRKHLQNKMATVRFTRNIQRHIECPTRETSGSTLREVLDEYFRDNERARGYVLDEQGKIRQHMVVFVDGDLVRDREKLSDPVQPNSVIDVIQALSGGLCTTNREVGQTPINSGSGT